MNKVFQPIITLQIVASLCLPLILQAQPTLNDLVENETDFPVTVTTELLEQDTIHAGDEFDWEIVVRWNQGMEFSPEVSIHPQVKNLEQINTSTVFRSGADQDGMFSETVFRYTFKATEQGDASIGTVEMSGEKEDNSVVSLKTEPVSLTVLPERVSIAKLITSAWNQLWVKITLISLIFIVLCVTCFLPFRTKKQDMPDEEHDQSGSIENAMTKAKSKRIEGDHKAFFTNLEQAVRLRLNHAHPGVSSTNLRDFVDVISPDRKVVFERFLHEYEEAKYTPVSPSSEVLDRVWDDVNRIISES